LHRARGPSLAAQAAPSSYGIEAMETSRTFESAVLFHPQLEISNPLHFCKTSSIDNRNILRSTSSLQFKKIPITDGNHDDICEHHGDPAPILVYCNKDDHIPLAAAGSTRLRQEERTTCRTGRKAFSGHPGPHNDGSKSSCSARGGPGRHSHLPGSGSCKQRGCWSCPQCFSGVGTGGAARSSHSEVGAA